MAVILLERKEDEEKTIRFSTEQAFQTILELTASLSI